MTTAAPPDTADAAGLGGLSRRAIVPPGTHGAIAFSARATDGASSVGLRVSGWLAEALPDAPQPARFEARTAQAAIKSAT